MPPRHPAGSSITYRVTHLAMTERPGYGYPPRPAGAPAKLLRAETPPLWYFLALYDAVGRDYAWDEMHGVDPDTTRAWLEDEAVEMWTLLRQGWPHGFFVLDARAPRESELAYFGLVPQAIGLGLGNFLLRTAILTAWERPGLERLGVKTCSLDHPRALATYQKNGFEVTEQYSRTRTLLRDHDPAHPTD